jgi:hypothetical protein
VVEESTKSWSVLQRQGVLFDCAKERLTHSHG